MEQETSPEYLYKVLSEKEWQESQQRGEVALSSIDKMFIHLAKEDQVTYVAQKFWQYQSYVVLKLAVKDLEGHLVYECNPGGITKYYHLYEGRIPLSAVVDHSQNKS